MKKGLFFLFCVAWIQSCKHQDRLPKGVLPQDKMQEVMWDMMNAGQYISAYVLTKDSLDKIGESTRVYGQVLQLHAVSREEFEKSYAYYREHPELMKVILDSLSKKQTYTVEKFQRDTIDRKNIHIDKKKIRPDKE